MTSQSRGVSDYRDGSYTGRLAGLALTMIAIAIGDAQAQTAEEIIEAVRTHDGEIQALALKYSLKEEFPDAEPWRAIPNRQLESSVTGTCVFMGDRFRLEIEGSARYEENVMPSDSPIWEYGNVYGFDGDRFIRIDHNQRAVHWSDESQGVSNSPLSAGLLLFTPGDVGPLADLDASGWRYLRDEKVGENTSHRLERVDSNTEEISRLWIAPTKSYRMTRFEFETPPGTSPYYGELTVLAAYEATEFVEAVPGIWLPTSIRETITATPPSGEPLVINEGLYTIEPTALNDDVPETAVDFSIPEGYTEGITPTGLRAAVAEHTPAVDAAWRILERYGLLAAFLIAALALLIAQAVRASRNARPRA